MYFECTLHSFQIFDVIPWVVLLQDYINRHVHGTVDIDHLHNDITHSALFTHLFLLAKGIHVIHCVIEKGAIGVMPVSCCAANCTNCFKRDAGIGLHTIPAKQVRREACLRAISRVGWEAK